LTQTVKYDIVLSDFRRRTMASKLLPQYVKKLVKNGRRYIQDRESPRYNPCARIHRSYKVTDVRVIFGDTTYIIDECESDLETDEPEVLVKTHEILVLNHVPA
jgi:hypothetical protein